MIVGNAPVDWVLVAFVVFKGLVFAAGMFFAVKWHYDQEKKRVDGQRLLRTGATFGAVFLVLLLVLLVLTFTLARKLGIDLSLP